MSDQIFETNKQANVIPGYTGHIPSVDESQVEYHAENVQKRIPGYGGYIKGVKSENLYGETYGTVTNKVYSNQIQRGNEIDPSFRFESSTKYAFVNQIELRKSRQVPFERPQLVQQQLSDLTYEQALQLSNQ